MIGLKGIVAMTDRGWYESLHASEDLEEVNFWKPSARRGVRAEQFTPFLFKLRAPANTICGFGHFVRYSRLPPWLAWETFGTGNGCSSFQEMQDRIKRIRTRIRYQKTGGSDEIGCVLIANPVFFPEDMWVAQPVDWPVRTQSEKLYDLDSGEGLRIWQECLTVAHYLEKMKTPRDGAEQGAQYGDPVIVQPRLGQGIFRIAITEAYGRACAITGEHSLPALEASHIKPFAMGGPNEVPNGLLLRADLHRLFDKGYLTVTPDAKVEVSGRLREDYQNGRTYYPLHGTSVAFPSTHTERPAREFLEWHNEKVFVA